MCKCKQGELKSVNPATNLVPWLPAVNASQSALIEVTVHVDTACWLPTNNTLMTVKSISAAKPQVKGLVISKEVRHGSTLLIKMAKVRLFILQQPPLLTLPCFQIKVQG